MARRSSARLRSRNSSTPKRVSLSHDASTRTPRTAPVKLSILREDGDMPGAFPSSASPSPRTSTDHVNKPKMMVPVKFDDSTPKNLTPIKPSDEEMHPKQYQQSTAQPLEEARWLGFSSMAPHTEPAKPKSSIPLPQGTPTKTSNAGNSGESPKFRFTFGREQSLELSPEAKKLMNEKREEAAKIRELMVANGEGGESVKDALQRKIAKPKGKKGRFSEVHMEQFKKMDSIATHASKSRPAFNAAKIGLAPVDMSSPKGLSLKRKASNAQLDEPNADQSLPRSPSKLASTRAKTSLPRSASVKDLKATSSANSPSPSKRTKTDEKAETLDKSNYDSPTQASIARTSNMTLTSATRIPAPTLSRSPSKPSLLLQDESKQEPPLLSRSPAKACLFAHASTGGTADSTISMTDPLLQRSPMKALSLKKGFDHEDAQEHQGKAIRLLSHSPLKTSVIAKDISSRPNEDRPSTPTPLLKRSPAKISLPGSGLESKPIQTPTKSAGGSIMDRFNLLRSSPIKSILRSPQRLYSNDPAKVAAGTHLASPASAAVEKGQALPRIKEGTPSVEKHVDFTSSTKARYERAQSESSSTPATVSTPSSEQDGAMESTAKQASVQYPDLPSTSKDAEVTPQKRRQTAAPYDFTFTSHGNGIIFGQSPNAPISAANNKSPSTIRHVSAEPQFPPPPPASAGSKKRKFDFENEKAADDKRDGTISDKENVGEAGEDRPSKRVKPNLPEPPAAKAATRLPTLGVRPKKVDKSTAGGKPKTISRARLNALAQPKRRG